MAFNPDGLPNMFNLTREQQVLLLLGVLLFLTGLGVKYWRAKNPPAHLSHIQSSKLHASP
jgi:hypothetical protein